MEDYGPRPMLELPGADRAPRSSAPTSRSTPASPSRASSPSAAAMTEIIDRRQIRHAHMVSISHRIMAEAMRANFDDVDAISTRVLDRAEEGEADHGDLARRLEAGGDLRSLHQVAEDLRDHLDLEVGQPPGRRGADRARTRRRRLRGRRRRGRLPLRALRRPPGQSALRHDREQPHRRHRLPARRPRRGLPGLHLDRRELRPRRRVRDRHEPRGRATSSATSSRTKSSRRSTSRSATRMPSTPGATWRSTTHIDIVGRRFDIWFDDDPIMRAGKFLI